MGWLIAFWGLIKAGVGETVGEKVAAWFFAIFKNRRRKPRRMDDKVKIGQLTQFVKDLKYNQKGILKRLTKSERETSMCLRDRNKCENKLTEAITLINGLQERVILIEKKTGIRTA